VTNTAMPYTEAIPIASHMTGESARGLYFYGITRGGLLAGALADAHDVQLLEFSGLAAVVRPVLLADFSLEVLQERLRSATALEAMVRDHNRVVEAIHAEQAILPAKFGTVYAHADDVLSGLKPARDALLQQLQQLEKCDEWALHLYADRDVIRNRISTEHPELRRLREQQAAARPGRAYFIERQRQDELEAATEQALLTLAQTAFDQLTARALAGQMNPVRTDGDSGEIEILRASFLVSRDRARQFEDDARSSADASLGLRCEYSGPWPPYSFAAGEEME
jgi:hypothetical protein